MIDSAAKVMKDKVKKYRGFAKKMKIYSGIKKDAVEMLFWHNYFKFS